jgi:polar amino acid transport system permease protein
MDIVVEVARGIPYTLMITIGAFVIGAIGGIPLALGRTSKRAYVRLPVRFVIDVVRGVPPVVWLFVLFYAVTVGGTKPTPLAAAIAGFGLIASAYMAEIYRGGLASIHPGQWEAGAALGLSWPAQMRTVIGPQVARQVIPASATFVIGLLKDSSIAYMIGVPEMVYRADNLAKVGGGDALRPFLVVGVLYLILSIPCGLLTRRLDANLRRRIAR